MADRSPRAGSLLAALDDALGLLADHARAGAGEGGRAGPGLPAAREPDPLPSLLAQCEALVAAAPGPEPLRSIHHFACTGGTVISKCVAALPNVVLLSEIDPLSTIRLQPGNSLFSPTDFLLAMRSATRPPGEEALAGAFLAAAGDLHARLAARGQALVIRDHAHSQFCLNVDAAARPTLLDLLRRRFATLALVTVRHPVDTYLALVSHDWHRHFSPSDPEEYAGRYRAFLDRHRDVPRVRYEDLVAAPGPALQEICRILHLPFSADALDLFGMFRMSGDSGRRDGPLAPRPRRPVPDDLRRAFLDSPGFLALCGELGYEADL